MSRLLGRAIRLFLAYVSVLAAVVVAGFLAEAVGIWAAVLWGILLVLALTGYLRARTTADPAR